MTDFNLFVAFVGGVVSFLSPCMLPIIPGFLAYLAGTSVSQSSSQRLKIFLNSLFFVLGFSVIFALLGVLLNSVLINSADEVQTWLARFGGGIIIIFGLYLVGLFKIPFLEKEYHFKVRTFSSQYLTSFFFGASLAAGWTPCVGAVLGGILGLAATAPASAFPLLLSYSLGLGLPFLVVGLFTSQAAGFINHYAGLVKILNIVFGILLIILGVLAFTRSLNLIANFELLNRWLLR